MWQLVHDGPLFVTPVNAGPWQYWFAQALVPFVVTKGPWVLERGTQSAGCADVGPAGWHKVQEGPLLATPVSEAPWQYWFAQAPVPFAFT